MKKTLIESYILLGSNLENPKQQVISAIDELKRITKTELSKVSHLYRSKPLGPADQPDYINAVVLLKTALSAHDLLKELQHIEKEHGRNRDTRRWGPRTLDLDLLIYGDKTINSPNLIVPHPELGKRNFVIYPLAEIAPALILPVSGQTVSALCASCPLDGLEKYDDINLCTDSPNQASSPN